MLATMFDGGTSSSVLGLIHSKNSFFAFSFKEVSTPQTRTNEAIVDKAVTATVIQVSPGLATNLSFISACNTVQYSTLPSRREQQQKGTIGNQQAGRLFDIDIMDRLCTMICRGECRSDSTKSQIDPSPRQKRREQSNRYSMMVEPKKKHLVGTCRV